MEMEEEFIGKPARASLRRRRIIFLIGFSVTALTILSMLIGVLAQTSKILKEVNNLQSEIDDGSSEEQTTNKILEELSSSILGAMDTSVDPCTDFYQYSCGTWIKNTMLPSDKPSYTKSFSAMAEKNNLLLQDILEQDWPIIGPYYNSCMDMNTINNLGYQPLLPLLNVIDTVSDVNSLMQVVGTYHTYGIVALFDIDVWADMRNPLTNILYHDQGGLGLPTRDYYFKTDNTSQTIRSEYIKHISRMLQLINIPQSVADVQAQAVFNFELQLANSSLSPVQMRDPNLIYNKLSVDSFAALTPNINWTVYRQATQLNLPANSDLIVTNSQFYTTLDSLLHNANNMEAIQYYLRYHAAMSSANYLSQPFIDERFNLTRLLQGVKDQPARWKRCVSYSDTYFPELLGRYFVMLYFAGNSKQAALSLVQNLESQYNADFDSLSWMDADTKAKAKQKLSMITNKIGYPDKWTSYDDLTINKTKFFDNTMQTRQWDFLRNMKQVNQPVDKSKWLMSPSTVNAYYEPTANEIVFPAAILQPPFFNISYPNWANYGGIGAVIGHEISHGFDDEGRQFDGNGNLTNWWTTATEEAFNDRAQCVVDLYDSYEVLPNVYINGELTEGENLADFGGIRMGYQAYKQAGDQISTAEMNKYFPGMTQDQLYFVSYAQIWCSVQTDAYLHYLTATNPHSAPQYRVIGPTSNFEQFWNAFNCEKGDSMHPPSNCRVW